MDTALITQLKILKMNESKPNFSELARMYDVDRRTVKKYYDGYSGKPVHHNKSSKLDEHETLIRNKLSIKGITVKAVYERKGINISKTEKGHPRFETAPGIQAQVDWKEDVSIANRHGEIFTFQVFAMFITNKIKKR